MKKEEPRLRLMPGDIVAAVAVLLLAALGGLLLRGRAPQRAGEQIAAVYQDGRLVREIDLMSLEEPLVFSIEGDYCNTVVAEKGRIRVESSNCPGENCVHTGWISQPGRVIVCLPNRVEIRITGESEVDAAAG